MRSPRARFEDAHRAGARCASLVHGSHYSQSQIKRAQWARFEWTRESLRTHEGTETTTTQVVDAYGGQHLEGLEQRQTGAREKVQAAGVFVLIGAEPRTDWLQEVLERDHRGFILTGADVVSERWPVARPPLPFETSMPGVFAVGDVRHGSVKRVAGAVGEGSVAIGSVHQYLAELERATTGRHP
jgi:thioredoxin reductase